MAIGSLTWTSGHSEQSKYYVIGVEEDLPQLPGLPHPSGHPLCLPPHQKNACNSKGTALGSLAFCHPTAITGNSGVNATKVPLREPGPEVDPDTTQVYDLLDLFSQFHPALKHNRRKDLAQGLFLQK